MRLHANPLSAMYVCLCNSVTDLDIRRAAAAGCRTLGDLTMRTGCGATCGCCLPMAEDLLAESELLSVVPAVSVREQTLQQAL